MNTLKTLLFNRFKIILLISTSIVFSMVLLIIRMKLAHSFFYLFLVWNLFLAVIPFTISTYLVSSPKLSKFGLVLWFVVWLLFLPNAPYIATDLIHLRLSKNYFIWLDLLLIGSFACHGIVLFYMSLLDMVQVLKPHMKSGLLSFGFIIVLFLSSFGVYLGRFLRYNSWEILSNPNHLAMDILDIALNPIINKQAWLFTLLFGAFLSMGFWLFRILSKKV